MSKSQEQGQALVLLGGANYKPHFQFYKFAEKKWSPLRKIDEGELSNCTYLNNKFYYITESDEGNHFKVFDIKTRRSTMLHAPNKILHGSAMCADDRFIYFCCEWNDDNSASAEVQRYDPQTNSFETLSPIPTKRFGANAIINQGCLYVLDGYDLYSVLSFAKYDFETKLWTALKPLPPRLPRMGYAVGVLNGKLYLCGGDRNKSVDVYDPTNDSWQPVADMNKARAGCLLVAREGKLLAIGGERSAEVYDPSENRWQMDDQMSEGLKMRSGVGGLISGGCVADDN